MQIQALRLEKQRKTT